MINEQYLEKFCISKINQIGKYARFLEQKKRPEDNYQQGRFDAFSEILAIIAKEQAYENNQVKNK